MIVADTSVWVDYFRGAPSPQTDLLDSILGREPVVIGDIILAEVLQGFRFKGHLDKARAILDGLVYADMLGREIAIASSRNYRALRTRGITVRKTIDIIIGTFCIVHNHFLLHADRDFEPMVQHLGLRVITP